jgi:2-oxoglutarate dehydrogenase E1 component
LEVLGTKSADKNIVWSGNSRDARLPYAMVDNDVPPVLSEGSSRLPTKTPLDDFKLSPPDQIKTLIFCSGQVYYLLARARAANQLKHVAIARIEQYSPFPFWEAKEVVDFYPNLEEVVYCQEESFNSGAWSFVEPRLDTVVRESEWYKSGKVLFFFILRLLLLI